MTVPTGAGRGACGADLCSLPLYVPSSPDFSLGLGNKLSEAKDSGGLERSCSVAAGRPSGVRDAPRLAERRPSPHRLPAPEAAPRQRTSRKRPRRETARAPTEGSQGPPRRSVRRGGGLTVTGSHRGQDSCRSRFRGPRGRAPWREVF